MGLDWVVGLERSSAEVVQRCQMNSWFFASALAQGNLDVYMCLKSWTVPGLVVRSRNWPFLSVWSGGLRESLFVCLHHTHVISSLVLYRNRFLEPTDMFVHLVPLNRA